MRCTLMNKNTPVLVAEYDTDLNGFTMIYEVLDIHFAPLVIEKQYAMEPEKLAVNLSKWFRGRGIPSWRDQLDLLLARLGVQTSEELLDKSFGLSLADQYWLRPDGSEICYGDINFFEHDFDEVGFLEASFSNTDSGEVSKVSLKSPNNTTDGMLRKAWIVENGERYLLKSGYRGDTLQPFNEMLASMICERLCFEHVPYVLDELKGKVVSKCKCFTTKDTEIIPAYQVMYNNEQPTGREKYERYVAILEEHGIIDARERLEDMLVLDYLIMNEDRHMNNFGVVRDVNTLEWLGAAPIFDSGQALNIVSYDESMISVAGEGRFFYGVEKFDRIIEVVRDFGRFDFGTLDSVVDDFRGILTNKMETAQLTEGRIKAVCKVLAGQIEKIRKMQ